MPLWTPSDGLRGGLEAAFQQAPLHAILVSRLYVRHNEAMSMFSQCMAAAAQGFSKYIESWVALYFATFRVPSREVSAHSWATICGTMVSNPDGHDEQWLKVFVGHLAVGRIMG